MEPRRILVEGGPLHTHAATWFAVSGTFPDRKLYRNEGMQLLEMERGRVVEDRLFEDTKVVIDALDHLSALGMDPGGDAGALAESAPSRALARRQQENDRRPCEPTACALRDTLSGLLIFV